MRGAIVVLALSLSGCTTVWYKDGGTEAEFNRDKYQCQIEVASAYPAAVQQVTLSPGYQAPMRTNCQTYGANTNCTTSPGATTAPVQAAIDMNANARGQATNSCMMARGYYTK